MINIIIINTEALVEILFFELSFIFVKLLLSCPSYRKKNLSLVLSSLLLLSLIITKEGHVYYTDRLAHL